MLLAEVQFMQRQAQNHFQHFLKLKVVKQSDAVILETTTINFLRLCSLLSFHIKSFKVFLAWREAATRAVSRRHQQEEAVSKAQRSINQGNITQVKLHFHV